VKIQFRWLSGFPVLVRHNPLPSTRCGLYNVTSSIQILMTSLPDPRWPPSIHQEWNNGLVKSWVPSPVRYPARAKKLFSWQHPHRFQIASLNKGGAFIELVTFSMGHAGANRKSSNDSLWELLRLSRLISAIFWHQSGYEGTRNLDYSPITHGTIGRFCDENFMLFLLFQILCIVLQCVVFLWQYPSPWYKIVLVWMSLHHSKGKI